MIRKLQALTLILAILFNINYIFADVGESAGNQILNSNLEARAMGFGGAFAGLADSLSAVRTNPAGLSYLTNPEILASYKQGLFETRYTFFGFAKPLSSHPGAFACSITTLEDENIELNFTNPDGSFKETKMVKAGRDYLATLSYSYLLGEEVSIGINLKILQSTLAEQYKATAYAGDIGFLIRPIGDRICFGLAARNFGTELKYITEKDTLQREYIYGMSFRVFETDKNKLSFIGDYIRTEKSRFNLGFEYLLQKKFALRAGYRIGYNVGNFTMGFGFNFRKISIDYAFVKQGEFSDAHIVSVRMKFGEESLYHSGENYFHRQMFRKAINEWTKVPEKSPDYKKAHEGINAARRYILAEKFYRQGEIYYRNKNYRLALESYQKAEESIKGFRDSQEKIKTIKSMLPQVLRKNISKAEEELSSAKKIGFDVKEQIAIYSEALDAYNNQNYKLSQDKLNLFWKSLEKAYKEGAEKTIKEVEGIVNKALNSGIEIPDSDKLIKEVKSLFNAGNYKLTKVKADQIKENITERIKQKLREIEKMADIEKLKREGKRNIAVSNFEARAPISASEAEFITDFFRSALVKTEYFNVLDRNNMDKILAEQGFQQTGCTTEECAVQMGKLLNVNLIAIGKCGMLRSRYILTVNIIDVETGKIVFSDSEDCYSEKEIEKMTTRIVEKIMTKFK